MCNTYRIVTDNTPCFLIDTEKQLPVLTPTIGEWYAAYNWSEALDNWEAGALAQYKGNGQWFNNDVDCTTEMIWCDFIVLQK